LNSKRRNSYTIFCRIKQEKLFENLFPAGATQNLRTATESQNILPDAEISV